MDDNKQSDFVKRLVRSKKIMNKVDSGDFSRGIIDREKLVVEGANDFQDETSTIENTGNVNNFSESKNSYDKIINSKLPEEIKRAMMEHPIQQVSLNETIDMKFVKDARRLMEKEGLFDAPTKGSQSNKHHINNLDNFLPILESMIEKIIDKKINELKDSVLSTNVNENLVIKVGGSIFGGKITSVKKTK